MEHKKVGEGREGGGSLANAHKFVHYWAQGHPSAKVSLVTKKISLPSICAFVPRLKKIGRKY